MSRVKKALDDLIEWAGNLETTGCNPASVRDDFHSRLVALRDVATAYDEFEDGYLDVLEGDLYGVVGDAALAAGVEVSEGQSLAIAHAVMRYMGAFEDGEAPAVRREPASEPPQ